MARGSLYPLLAVSIFCGGGCHCIAMESSLRFCRPQARYPQRYLGLVVATILFGLSRTFWTLAARYVPYYGTATEKCSSNGRPQ